MQCWVLMHNISYQVCGGRKQDQAVNTLSPPQEASAYCQQIGFRLWDGLKKEPWDQDMIWLHDSKAGVEGEGKLCPSISISSEPKMMPCSSRLTAVCVMDLKEKLEWPDPSSSLRPVVGPESVIFREEEEVRSGWLPRYSVRLWPLDNSSRR